MMEWRTIRGWPRHQVSDNGQVRIARQALRGRRPGIVNPWVAKVGYLMVNLYDGGKRKKAYVHQLVCGAFHGPAPSPKHEVGHRDGARTNNRVDNLRWVTRIENCDDSAIHGTRLRGEHQNGAKLTAATVLEIRRLAAAGVMQKDIAARFGVSASAIWHVIRRNTWAHVFDGLLLGARIFENTETKVR